MKKLGFALSRITTFVWDWLEREVVRVCKSWIIGQFMMLIGPLEKIARVMLLPGVRIVEIVPWGNMLVTGSIMPVLALVGLLMLGIGPAKVLLSWTRAAHVGECHRDRR